MSNDKKIYSSPQYRNLGIKPGFPDTNFSKIYPKDDGWYTLDSDGKEVKITGAVVKDGKGNLSTLRIDSCNTADGDYSTVSGGYSNYTDQIGSTISGGYNNSSEGQYSTIAGGGENKIVAVCFPSIGSSILGGTVNHLDGNVSVIGGGFVNSVKGSFSSVVSGGENSNNSDYSSILSGKSNRIQGNYSTVLGGEDNVTIGISSIIGNGTSNRIEASGGCGVSYYPSILNGNENTASGDYSLIGNGLCNVASGCIHSSVLNGSSNTASSDYSSVLNGAFNTASGSISSVLNGASNTASGVNSLVLNGCNNIASGSNSSVINGSNNVASGCIHSSVLNGNSNTTTGPNSSILNGSCNTASGCYSSVLNGQDNTASGVYSTVVNGIGSTASHPGSTIIGSNTVSVCAQTTHMTKIHLNSPDSTTLFNPVLVLDTVDNNMVKTRGMGGLFSQLTVSPDITNVSTEESLIIGGTGGTGYLYVPQNGFQVGDSFTARLGGHIKALNNQTLQIRIKTNGTVILADTGVYQFNGNVGQTAAIKSWDMSINFTIRAVGGTGAASISSGGIFNHNKDNQNNLEGLAFHSNNNTNFDTTISNTLEITAQWGSANSANSIFSEYFVLTKIY